MLFFPNAKINVGLDIVRRREDGYHDIETVMTPVAGLCDVLEITPAAEFDFAQTGAGLDCPAEDNLCVRAYRLMEREYGVGGARIHLHKMIPSGAGLGGGSADAAFTLKGIDRVFSLGLPATRLRELAARLGSDTAFFIDNTTQLARGRGELLTPFALPLGGKWLMIVKPPVHISTAEAYRGVTPHAPETPLAERLSADPTEWRTGVANDFEASLFAAHPTLAALKQKFYDEGALYASLSGSGSALYAIFDRRPATRTDVDFVYLEKIS